jgi:hypothetical protein
VEKRKVNNVLRPLWLDYAVDHRIYIQPIFRSRSSLVRDDTTQVHV